MLCQPQRITPGFLDSIVIYLVAILTQNYLWQARQHYLCAGYFRSSHYQYFVVFSVVWL